MALFTPGFRRKTVQSDVELPPGQYLTEDFPVLSAGPTPRVPLDTWEFTITGESGQSRAWTWDQLKALPAETQQVDLHCVTRWTKLGTSWRGVSLDLLLADVETTANFALVHAYGGYTTNLPLADLLGGKAWIAYEFEGAALAPEHGGPARLLVPHLYLWKSAKWVRGIELLPHDNQGFWERAGYHDYGDPWREQRYQGD